MTLEKDTFFTGHYSNNMTLRQAGSILFNVLLFLEVDKLYNIQSSFVQHHGCPACDSYLVISQIFMTQLHKDL